MQAIKEMPCIICEIENQRRRDAAIVQFSQPFITTVHHLVDKGYRSSSGGHIATIPLCQWHHQGYCLDGISTNEMVSSYGWSLALHKKKFVGSYGSERDLLETINLRLPKQLVDTTGNMHHDG